MKMLSDLLRLPTKLPPETSLSVCHLKRVRNFSPYNKGGKGKKKKKKKLTTNGHDGGDIFLSLKTQMRN